MSLLDQLKSAVHRVGDAAAAMQERKIVQGDRLLPGYCTRTAVLRGLNNPQVPAGVARPVAPHGRVLGNQQPAGGAVAANPLNQMRAPVVPPDYRAPADTLENAKRQVLDEASRKGRFAIIENLFDRPLGSELLGHATIWGIPGGLAFITAQKLGMIALAASPLPLATALGVGVCAGLAWVALNRIQWLYRKNITRHIESLAGVTIKGQRPDEQFRHAVQLQRNFERLPNDTAITLFGRDYETSLVDQKRRIGLAIDKMYRAWQEDSESLKLEKQLYDYQLAGGQGPLPGGMTEAEARQLSQLKKNGAVELREDYEKDFVQLGIKDEKGQFGDALYRKKYWPLGYLQTAIPTVAVLYVSANFFPAIFKVLFKSSF